MNPSEKHITIRDTGWSRIVDTEEGRIEMLNPGVPKLYGHPAPTAMFLADYEDEEGRCLQEQLSSRRGTSPGRRSRSRSRPER